MKNKSRKTSRALLTIHTIKYVFIPWIIVVNGVKKWYNKISLQRRFLISGYLWPDVRFWQP